MFVLGLFPSQETAPHILAALEAQRARVSQQQPPEQSRVTEIPGFVFVPERDRFFRSVKNPLGTPGPVRKKKTFSVGEPGASESNGPPADKTDSPATACGPAEGLSAAAAAAANEVNSAATKSQRSWNAGGRGIHSFVMGRRKGFYGVGSSGTHGTFTGRSMGGKQLPWVTFTFRFVDIEKKRKKAVFVATLTEVHNK